jgi:2-hydroxychromene-2-carboxylate isomerase
MGLQEDVRTGKAQYLWIPGPLPGMNEIIDLRGHRGRRSKTNRGKRFDPWNNVKSRWEQVIRGSVRVYGINPQDKAWFRFIWVERHRLRDPDNVTAGGRKIVLDGLVRAGVLPDDRWKQVLGWRDDFAVNKIRPGVMLYIYRQAPGK